jgi:hypothetical protein
MEKPSTESWKQLTVSVEKLPASMGQHAKISAYATERAQLLLGCYRSGEANDPDTYVAAISATLARYSEQIITDVTHPVSGLPAKKSWLPTVKEVFDACELEADRDRQQTARERRIQEQFAAREEQDRLDAVKPSLEQLREKYGPNWGLTPNEPAKKSAFKAPSWQGIVSSYSTDPSRLQRLIKAALAGVKSPYGRSELEAE